MIHIKGFIKFNEAYSSNDEISFGAPEVTFGITHNELREILFEITDEFSKLDYTVDNCLQSSIIEKDPNSFVITFFEEARSVFDQKVLYYLEPKIFSLIEEVSEKLGIYDLYISYSDFGESDLYYELVVTKKGSTPTKKIKKYDRTKLYKMKD